MNEILNEQIKEISLKSEHVIVKTISDLIEIPSVRNEDDKAPGAPFGKEVRRALDYAIDLAKKMGMRTFVDPKGRYGYIEVGDENLEEMVGIVGHLDVVPGGSNDQWKTNNPFKAYVNNNTLYGRGSLDDKGPLVINLYALKNLIDLGVDFNKRVRIIIGTAEETTWECIEAYVKNEELPTISYSPDADFPVINAEKTIAQMDCNTDEDVDFELEALGAYNATPDKVVYSGNKIFELKNELSKLNYEYKDEGNSIIVIWKSSHAMSPESGINAISRLCIALYNIGENSKIVDFIANNIKETYNAELIVGDIEDKISGKLKLNIGRIKIKDGKGYFSIDSRIPVLISADDIIKKYEAALSKHDIKMEIVKIQEKLYVEEGSFLVSTLMEVYKEVTGDQNAKVLSTGGGTYARAFDNCVAFGAVFSNMNQLDNMHQPNECLELKFLKDSLEIYTKAIYMLTR